MSSYPQVFPGGLVNEVFGSARIKECGLIDCHFRSVDRGAKVYSIRPPNVHSA